MNDSQATGKKTQHRMILLISLALMISCPENTTGLPVTQHSVVLSGSNNNVARIVLWLPVHSGRLSDRDC